jgi:hypothetical protein
MSPASYQTAPPRAVSSDAATLGRYSDQVLVVAPHGFAVQSPVPGADTLIDLPLSLRGEFPPRSPSAGSDSRAGNGTRTRDPNLGKVVLYQLSYSREAERILVSGSPRRNDPRLGVIDDRRGSHGGEGDRTPDLVNAIHALSQLSYAPGPISHPRMAPRQHGNVARALPSVNEVCGDWRSRQPRFRSEYGDR